MPSRPANANEFARQFIAAREGAGMNRAEVARRMQVEPSLISKYERGYRVPTPERLGQINTILGAQLQLPASAAAAAPAAKKAPAVKAAKAASKRTPGAPPAKAAKNATKKATKKASKKAVPQAATTAPPSKAPSGGPALKAPASITKKATKKATKKVPRKSPAKKAAKKATAPAPVASAVSAPSGTSPRLLIEVRDGQVRAYDQNGEVAALVLDLGALQRTAPSRQLATLGSMMGEIAKLSQPLYRRAAETLARQAR